jgi:hypothetical protein
MILKNSFPKTSLAVGIVAISAIVLSGCTTTSVTNRLKSMLGQTPAAAETGSPAPSAPPVGEMGSAQPYPPTPISPISPDETSTPKPTTTGNTDVDKAVIDMDTSFNKAKTTDTTGTELSF